MNIKDVINQLELTVHSGNNGLENKVSGGYTSDLLSDVIGNADAGTIWITLQTHKNVMAIASLKDLAAVILVKDLEPDTDMANQSNSEGIPVLGTSKSAFEISGALFNLLNK
jgi:serine kinase of HPr protein (carbohydrate metabolism regulator)